MRQPTCHSLPRELCSLECVCSVLSQAVPRVGSHIFHHSQDSELFQRFYNHIHPAPSPPSHPRPYFRTDTTLFSISIMLSFLECHLNGILPRGTFWDWLLFTQLTSLETHGSGRVDGWFALIAGQCCGCAQTTLQHSPLEGRLGCLQMLAIHPFFTMTSLINDSISRRPVWLFLDVRILI